MAMEELKVPLDRDLFFRTMIHAFAKSLEETVGLNEAAGYVSVVGSEIGQWIERQYQESSGKTHFTPDELAELLVDLKRRIGGEFFVVSVGSDKIVLGNHRCPFDELAIGRPSLCRMTSNVFGRIAADQMGYARVSLEKTIAQGHGECLVVIHFHDSDEDPSANDHEFFRIDQPLM